MSFSIRWIALSVLLTAVALLPTRTDAQLGKGSVPDDLKTGWDTITPDQASQWLNVLAGPVFQGRGSGQEGYTKAAHWVAGKIAEFGLEPMGDGGTYFQMLPMSRMSLDATQTSLSGPGDFRLEPGPQLGFNRFADSGAVTGKIVVVSLTGRRPTLDDNVSLRDKVVIFVTDDEARSIAPFLIGRQNVAAALRVVDNDCQTDTQVSREGGRQRGGSGVAGTIRRDAAEKLLAAAGGESAWLDVAADVPFAAHETEAEATLQLRARQEPAAIPNVIGWIPGSDPELRNEYVVIGSHLDHLGIQNDTMFPGADDNGSGSTAVLSIARAMATNPVKPKRSVLFIWFAAEEIGLVGSAHYVDHPLLPLEKMVCMFNIDMVGRNEEKENEAAEDNLETVHLIGSKQGDTGLHDVIMRANESVNFQFEYDEEGVFGRSDQANFFKKGTSVAFLFGGFHPDYHRPGDGPEKINYDKIAAAARLFYLSIHYAAEHGPFPRPATGDPSADATGEPAVPAKEMTQTAPHDGNWTAVSARLAGNAFPDEVTQSISMKLDGEKYSVSVGDRLDEGTVVINAGVTPHQMTITGVTGPNQGKTIFAIFESGGADELRICYELTGKKFPETMESTAENGYFAVKFARKRN